MAVALDSTGSGAVTTSGTTTTVNITSATTGADCFAFVTLAGTSMASFTSTGWTQIGTIATGGTPPMAGVLLYRRKVAGDTTFSIVANASGKGSHGWVSYTGLDTTTPYDTATQAANMLLKNGASTSVATPSVSAADATHWALAFFASRSTTSGNKVITFTPPGGLTERVDINNSGAASSAWTGVEIADSNGTVTSGAHSYTATASFSETWGIGALLYLNPAAAANPKIDTLTDDFAGTVVTTKWPNASGGVSYSGGVGQIPISGGVYNSFESAQAYDFASSAMSVQWASVPDLTVGAASREVLFRAYIDANNDATMYRSGTNTSIGLRLRTTGSNSDTIVTTSDTWWRIRESAGTMYWDTSSDGSTWTNRRSLAHSFSAGQLGAIRAQILSGDYGVEASATTTCDNFNVAGSATLTASPSDTAGATDAAAVQVAAARTQGDTAGGTDSAATVVDATRAPSDSAGGTDTATTVVTATRGPGDTAGATDTAGTDLAAVRAQDDTAGATDTVAVAKAIVITVTDTASGSDSASSSLISSNGVSADDPAGATDSATRTIDATRSQADTAGATDAVTATRDIVAFITDTAGATDTAARTIDTARSVSDSAGGSDTASTTGAGTITSAPSDSAGATDTTVVAVGASRSQGDPAGASDAVTVLITRDRALADFAAAADSVTAVLVRVTDETVTDSIGGTDYVTVTIDRLVQVADAVAASDLAEYAFGPHFTGPPSPSRTMAVTRELRVLAVPAENRTMLVPPTPRLIVPAENRTLTIPPESRTLEVATP